MGPPVATRPGPHTFFFASGRGGQISGIVTVEPGSERGHVVMTLVAAGNRLEAGLPYTVTASLGGQSLDLRVVADSHGIAAGEASRQVRGRLELVPVVTVSGHGF